MIQLSAILIDGKVPHLEETLYRVTLLTFRHTIEPARNLFSNEPS